jgi:hypothetical protein
MLVAVLTPLVGSSSRMISGWRAKALATSRSFLSPWGSVRAGRPSLSASPNISATSRALRRRRGRPQAREEAARSSEAREDRGGECLGHRQRGEDVHELKAARHAQARQSHGPAPADVAPLNVTVPTSAAGDP